MLGDIQRQCELLDFIDAVLFKWLQFLVSLQPVQHNLTVSPDVCSELVLTERVLNISTKSAPSSSSCSNVAKGLQ